VYNEADGSAAHSAAVYLVCCETGIVLLVALNKLVMLHNLL